MAELNQTTWNYIANRNLQIADLLALHKSPVDENSYAKGIPYTEQNMKLLRQLGLMMGIRLRYRGPRTQIWFHSGKPNVAARRLTCLQKDATSVAVYPR